MRDRQDLLAPHDLLSSLTGKVFESRLNKQTLRLLDSSVPAERELSSGKVMLSKADWTDSLLARKVPNRKSLQKLLSFLSSFCAPLFCRRCTRSLATNDAGAEHNAAHISKRTHSNREMNRHGTRRKERTKKETSKRNYSEAGGKQASFAAYLSIYLLATAM